jgi:hypothetical protein
MLIWARTRKSSDRNGTSKKVEIRQLSGGSCLPIRYESVDATVSTSDHWFASLEEAYAECDQDYGVDRDDWR